LLSHFLFPPLHDVWFSVILHLLGYLPAFPMSRVLRMSSTSAVLSR
jgi:hypothetical protein